MITSVTKKPFAGVTGGAALGEFDVSDVSCISIAVDFTGVSGTPTNYRVIALAMEGTNVIGSATQYVRRTADATALGVFFLNLQGTTVLPVEFVNTFTKIRVIADFTAGTVPSMAGNLYLFAQRGN
jgi:hypothetical protein